MKKQNMFVSLFLAGFMVLFFGSVSSADPMMPPGTAVDISHCAQLEPTAARPACEAAAHGGPGHHDPNMPPPGGCDPNLAPDVKGACGFTGNHGGPNDHVDPCMNMAPGPAQDECYKHQGDHHGDEDAAHCRAMGMADGSPHVDPPQDVLDQVQAEYEANCKSGNCFLGEGNYKLLEGMGHTRAKVDCFLAEGHRQHDEQHGGPGDGNHPPAP